MANNLGTSLLSEHSQASQWRFSQTQPTQILHKFFYPWKVSSLSQSQTDSLPPSLYPPPDRRFSQVSVGEGEWCMPSWNLESRRVEQRDGGKMGEPCSSHDETTLTSGLSDHMEMAPKSTRKEMLNLWLVNWPIQYRADTSCSPTSSNYRGWRWSSTRGFDLRSVESQNTCACSRLEGATPSRLTLERICVITQRTLFEQAEKGHLRGREQMKVWTVIQCTDPRAKS